MRLTPLPPAGAPTAGPPPRELLERAVHDLKNPLAVVRASLEWLELELTDREDAVDAVRDARTAAERLLCIVDDLEALARLDGGLLERLDAVHLGPLLEEVARSASARLARRSVSVVAHAPVGLLTSGDARLLGRSLGALVDATARGAPPGSCVDISASSRAGDGALTIELTLHGSADAGALQPALGALEASGLGVYLALRVIEAYGGSMGAAPTTVAARIVIELPR